MAIISNITVPVPKKHVTISKQPNGRQPLVLYELSEHYDRQKGYASHKRTVIGHLCPDSKTMMNPTAKYKDLFPDEWAKVSKTKSLPSIKLFGLFCACQAICDKTTLMDILQEVYGLYSLRILDFSMYSILSHSDTSQSFEAAMSDELLYSSDKPDDYDYDDLFKHRMSRAQELLFRKEWALHCKAEGVEEVWLCIDGSNDDCKSKGVDIATSGQAKSKKNTHIVSFTYAVTAKGLPVTWETYQGNLVDAKALKSVIDFLASCGIRVKGVVLDRGYCDANAISYLIREGISYVIMVKGHPEGVQKIVHSYARKIRMDADHWVKGTHLFAIMHKEQLFENLKHKDYVTLFFDYTNASERVSTLLDNLTAAARKAEEQLNEGKNPSIDEEYKSMLVVAPVAGKDGTQSEEITLNTEALQKAIDAKGLYCIASSNKFEPEDIHNFYVSRDSSEIQFRFFKTQLGYGKVRVRCTNSVRAKFTVGFVSSVIRYEMEQAAKALGKTTNQMILEINRLEMQRINEVYAYTHTESARISRFYENLGVKDVTRLIDSVVKFENDRASGTPILPRHKKPGPAKGSHWSDNSTNEEKKPGVKVGTRRSAINEDGSPRKKPGVAKGTKRGIYNKDGSLRKKPGPKPGSHHTPKVTA